LAFASEISGFLNAASVRASWQNEGLCGDCSRSLADEAALGNQRIVAEWFYAVEWPPDESSYFCVASDKMRVRCRRWIRPRERVRARCSLSQLCAELELEGEDQEEQKEPLGLPGRGAKGGDAQSPPVPEDAQSPTSPAQSRAVPRSVEAKAEAQSKREARMLERQRSTVDRRRVAQEQRQSRAEERHKRKTEADIEKQLRREQARLAREAAQQNTQKQGSPRGVATNQDQTDREEDEDDHNEEQRRGGSARGGADKIADRDDSKGKEAPIAPAATSPLDLVIDFVWENQRLVGVWNTAKGSLHGVADVTAAAAAAAAAAVCTSAADPPL